MCCSKSPSKAAAAALSRRPAWKQPCKVAAPQAYSLQWQHVNLRQLEDFPATLRDRSSDSHRSNQQQQKQLHSYDIAPLSPVDVLAAIPSMACGVKQPAVDGNAMQRHSAKSAEHHQDGQRRAVHRYSNNAEARSHQAAAALLTSNKDQQTAVQPEPQKADALSLHAQRQHMAPVTPARSNAAQAQPSSDMAYAAQQSSKNPPKQGAALCSYASHPVSGRSTKQKQHCSNESVPAGPVSPVACSQACHVTGDVDRWRKERPDAPQHAGKSTQRTKPADEHMVSSEHHLDVVQALAGLASFNCQQTS